MRIVAEGVGWGVGGETIVDGVSLSADAGETVGVLGPNGSGKSSLLRLLAGIRRPARGRVLLDETDLRGYSRRAVARRIALVEQAVTTDQNPTVRDVIDLGRVPHRSAWSGSSAGDDATLTRVARETDLEEHLERRYSTLSGGERQRVQIARAFAQEPDVMILDEPTNHLDIRHQLGLLVLVRRLVRDSSATAIMALHDLNLAAMFCDRLLILDSGRLAASGTPPEVVTAETIRSVFGVQATVTVDDAGIHVRLAAAPGVPGER